MTDEHFSRYWTESHAQFSDSLDRGLLRLGHFLGRRVQRRQAIGKTYAPVATVDAPESRTGRGAFAGLMACLTTTALLVTVAWLATNGAIDTSGLRVVGPDGSPIVTHVIVA